MRRIVLALFVGVAAACGSSTQNVTSPSTVKCAVAAAATPTSFSAAGGSGTLTVSTNRECQWSATPAAGWIQLGASPSGQGEGSVSFSVASNSDPAVRKATITVSDQQVAITQEAAPCTFTVSPRSDSVGAAGGRRTIAVTASNPQCAWTARSNVDWLAIVDGGQTTGSGKVTYEARATTGPPRSGTLLVADQVVTVAQGQGCSRSITPASQNVAASGGSGTITVTTDAGCTWSAQSSAPWIAITSGQTGTGPGTVGFSVSPSGGPLRTGTLTVDGHVFTVSQASGCTYTLDPSSQAIPAAGASGSVSVRSEAGCQWSAGSNAPWLTITAGGTGSGDGRVQFTAAASTGPARSATVTIANRSFVIDQASGCSYALVPSALDVGEGNGTGSFAVNTGSGCPWTATSNEPWITITGSPNGTGNGTVNFTVTFNTMGSPARSGTISVTSQTFTVRQAAGVPCVYTLTPTSQNIGAGPGASSFLVTTVRTCTWRATSNAPWIAIPNWPSGAGTAVVVFTWDANPPGAPARTGTISVANLTFTLNQGSAPSVVGQVP